MQRCRRAVIAVIAVAVLVIAAMPASAGPPGYLVLRRMEAPAKHNQPGKYDATMYDTRTSGYAYGYFGVTPRAHFSRHFGTYRNFTQWALW